MAEREVTIKISAKNLTEAEFKKARQGLAGISGAAGRTTQKTSGLQRAFSSFGKAAPGALKVVTAAAAATAGAVAALGVGVFKLGQRGAELVSITKSFQSLTAAAGQSGDTMVAITRTATKGLITDLDIMGAANKGLLLGLPITSQSMGELAKTSVVLGKAMGQGAGKSLDDLIVALGRSSPLILDNLGLTVKVGDANLAYAKKLGKTVAQLTEAEKKTAFYEAALEAARVKVAQIGGVQITFGDQLQRGITFVTNFTDSLSMMISKSPPLMAGMKAAGEAVVAAFGGDQQGVVLGIVNIIERAALMAIEFGKTGIAAAGVVYRGFQGVKTVILGIAVGYTSLSSTIAEFIAATMEAAASIPMLGNAYKPAASAARTVAEAITDVNAGLKENLVNSAIAAAGNDVFGQSLNTATVAMDSIKMAMVNAGMSQQQLNQAEAAGVIANENLGTSIPGVVALLEEFRLKQQAASEDVRMFGEKIDGVGVLATVQTANIAAAFERMGIAMQEQLKKTAEQAEKDFEAIKASGLATAKAVEEAQQKSEEAKREAAGETSGEFRRLDAQTVAGAMGSMAHLGGKFKIFAVGQAIISTYLAAAKSLAMYGWPAGLVAMAGAIAAGLATVMKIKSTGFATGTAGLDYQQFGPGTQTILHGNEAVIPQGGGHRLADEIAGALSKKARPSRDTDNLAASFDRMGAMVDGLPRAIQRAVRDGMLLAT